MARSRVTAHGAVHGLVRVETEFATSTHVCMFSLKMTVTLYNVCICHIFVSISLYFLFLFFYFFVPNTKLVLALVKFWQSNPSM